MPREAATATHELSVIGPLLHQSVPFFARRSMAMCAVDDCLVLFGGVGAAGTESILDVSNDCWTFTPETLTWRQLPQRDLWPSPRRCVGIAPTATGISIWGGSGTAGTGDGTRYTFLNDWWHLDLASGAWTMLHQTDDHRQTPSVKQRPAYPEPRYTPVFLSTTAGMLLFGGYTEDRLGKRKLNDTWLHNAAGWRRVASTGCDGYRLGASWPGVRYGCMSAVAGDAVFVFGGFSDEGDHNDLWRFDLTGERWHLLRAEASGADVPAPRYCAAFAYHAGRLFLFGGRSRKNARHGFNDLWTCDLEGRRWERLYDTPTPHVYDASALVPAYHAKASSAVLGDHWYLWGGEGIAGHVSDFWRFSLTALQWQLLQPARPDDPIFW